MARNHWLVVLEDLRVKAMTASAKGTTAEPGKNVAQKAGLNRAILQSGWGETSRMLDYKTKWYGSELLKVLPPGTSQECSKCHVVDADSRVSRDLLRCTNCGHTGTR
jgi:putative transposase